MGTIRTSATQTVRPFVTDGLPASGANPPAKSDFLATFGVVEDAVDAARAIADAAVAGVRFITQSIRVRSTGNVVIASALEDGDTLNGVTLATGDHVFLGSQTAPAENGIYTVVASGAASRATFADSAAELAYIAFLVTEGTVGAGERWTLPLASASITVGSTALNFAPIGIEVDYAGEVTALQAQVGEDGDLGWTVPIVATGSSAPTNYTVIDTRAAAVDDVVTLIEFSTAAAGSVTVFIASVSALAATMVRSQVLSAVAGVNIVPLSLPRAAGQFVGIMGGVKFQSSSNPGGETYWQMTGLPTTGSTVVLASQHRFEFRFETKTGLLADISAAGSGASSGVGLLSGADASGLTDATAAFATARAAHPFPQVPPGTYALTALPASGDGLWGPGRVLVDGARFPIPAHPDNRNLQAAVRSALEVEDGDVLVVFGDSIGLWALASSRDTHWLTDVVRGINLGTAKDDPVMAAFDAHSTYLPSFYGVTIGGSTSEGSRGPIHKSLILGVDAYIEFTGVYEQVDVFGTRETGGGTLSFTIDGAAAYHTKSYDGATELDHHSGATATGQTASKTYRITATGGAVEITGLIRDGVKVAASPPRLRVIHAAHGSFMIPDFTNNAAAPVVSALAQAAHFGGRVRVLVALGINDSFSATSATIATNADALVDALEAAGVEKIYAAMPLRPSAFWTSAYYTGGRTFDGAVSAMRRAYRQRGVTIIPTDARDWLNSGLLSGDGLHPNDAGEDVYAQMVISGLAGLYG